MQQEYLPLCELMEGIKMRASELEEILLNARVSTDHISERSGVSVKVITYIAQGFHKDELLSADLVRKIRSVL